MINELLLMTPLFLTGLVIVFLDKIMLEVLMPIVVAPVLLVTVGFPFTLLVAILIFKIYFMEVKV